MKSETDDNVTSLCVGRAKTNPLKYVQCFLMGLKLCIVLWSGRRAINHLFTNLVLP